MRMTRLILFALLALSYRAAQAECAYPQAPTTVPDGKKATETEMLEAMSAYKKYDADVTAYIACLDEETKARLKEGGATSQMIELKTLQLRKQNAAVDELQTKAHKFNEQVRAYKARG
jgi:hypothetical protein